MVQPVTRRLDAIGFRPQQISELVGGGTVAAFLQQVRKECLAFAGRSAGRVPFYLTSVVAIDAQPSEAANLPTLTTIHTRCNRLFGRAPQQPHRIGALGGVKR